MFSVLKEPGGEEDYLWQLCPTRHFGVILGMSQKVLLGKSLDTFQVRAICSSRHPPTGKRVDFSVRLPHVHVTHPADLLVRSCGPLYTGSTFFSGYVRNQRKAERSAPILAPSYCAEGKYCEI